MEEEKKGKGKAMWKGRVEENEMKAKRWMERA